MTELLRQAVADALGAHAEVRVVDELAVYLELLKRWNRRHNLTGLTRDEDLARVGIADSLRAAPLLPTGGPVLDVGSGAGLPAIVLAILDRSRPWWLIEPRRKRVSFLLEVVHELGLSHVRVVQQRLDQLPLEGKAPPLPAGLITSRAISGIDEDIAERLRPGGIWLRTVTETQLEELRRHGAPEGFELERVSGEDLPAEAARWMRLRRLR
jgi:16S rRNA (guanine527-N7)-methyltransferase